MSVSQNRTISKFTASANHVSFDLVHDNGGDRSVQRNNRNWVKRLARKLKRCGEKVDRVILTRRLRRLMISILQRLDIILRGVQCFRA